MAGAPQDTPAFQTASVQSSDFECKTKNRRGHHSHQHYRPARSRSTATTCHDSFASCDVVLSDTRARPDARRASDKGSAAFHATTSGF